MQRNTIQYNAVQYNAIQYNTTTYNAYLARLLQCWHPGSGQMTILQHHPRAILHGFLDHAHSNRALTLAQGQRAQLWSAETLRNRRTIKYVGHLG